MVFELSGPTTVTTSPLRGALLEMIKTYRITHGQLQDSRRYAVGIDPSVLESKGFINAIGGMCERK